MTRALTARPLIALALAIALSVALSAAGVVLAAAPAAAATGPLVAGSANPTAITATHSTRITYTITSDLAYTSAALGATPGALLQFVPGSAEVDGVSDPSVTPGSTITIPLSDGTAGSTHSVSYVATPLGTASANGAPAATLSFSDTAFPAGTTVAAAAVPLAINRPDLAVSDLDGGGSSTLASVPAGGSDFVLLEISNAGAGAPPTTLILDVPAPLSLNETGVFELADDSQPQPVCSPLVGLPGQVGCPIGAVSADGPLQLIVPIDVAASAVVGQSVTLGISVQPTDPLIVDANQANNALTQRVTVVGTPKLSVGVSLPAAKLALGKSSQLTLTVHNDGADVTAFGFASIGLENAHFAITAFDGKELDPNDFFGSSGSSDSGSGSIDDLGIPTGGGITVSPLSQSQRTRLSTALASQANRPTALSAPGSLGRAIATAKDPGNAAGGSGGGSDAFDPSQERIWDLSGLKHGQTFTAHLTLQAKSLGADRLALVALSEPADPGCLTGLESAGDGDGNLDLTDLADLPSCITVTGFQAVKAQIAPAVATAKPLAEPALPATGSPTTVPALLAVLLLLMGALALRLGRRRA